MRVLFIVFFELLNFQGNCLDVKLMMQIKKLILYFILTMKSYGYVITPLYSLLQNFRFANNCLRFRLKYFASVCSDQYNEILMRVYCSKFESEIDNDNYAPLIVENEAQRQATLGDFPHYKRGGDNVSFFDASFYLKACF